MTGKNTGSKYIINSKNLASSERKQFKQRPQEGYKKSN